MVILDDLIDEAALIALVDGLAVFDDLFDQIAACKIIGQAGLLLGDVGLGVKPIDRDRQALDRAVLHHAVEAEHGLGALEEEGRQVRRHRNAGEGRDIGPDPGAGDASATVIGVRAGPANVTGADGELVVARFLINVGG